MNRVAFSILGIDIYFYSLCIILGVLISFYLIKKESKKQGLDTNKMLDLIFYGLIIGIIGARIYYVLFNLDYYKKDLLQIFNLRGGGLAIHGGIISALIFIYFYSKKNKLNILKVLDIIVPGVIIAQSIGRWGNFFNMEAHGGITTYENLKNLFIPNFIINGMKINGNYYFPTFYFESLWCALGFIIILIMRKNKNLKLGTLTGFYLMWYSFGRFFIEVQRTDSLMIFNIKAAMLISLIGFLAGIIIIIYSIKTNKNYKSEVIK